jgi:hypothetical protein
MEERACILCNANATRTRTRPDRNKYAWVCCSCGTFYMSRVGEFRARMQSDQQRADLARRVRRSNREGKPYDFTSVADGGSERDGSSVADAPDGGATDHSQ